LKHLGRYILKERIGKGGMGEVYRALDPLLPRRRVAIKTLSSLAPADLARFQREAEAISMVSMSSRHIVKIFELGEVEGAPFIVMELLQGQDLESLIRKGRLEISRAVDIILGVCAGAWACHRRGILHRDLKPRNVFLHEEDEGEVVKILDFGVSTFPFAKEVTGPYQVVGTVRYMSPEQLVGAGIDDRSDLYAIGVLLYQCLTDRAPFEAASDRERVGKILLGAFAPTTHHRPEIPSALDAIVRRAIARDPGERFQTARDLGQALIPFANAAKQILFTENFQGPVRPIVEPMSRAVGSAPSTSSSSGSLGPTVVGELQSEGASAQPTASTQQSRPGSGVVPVAPLRFDTSTRAEGRGQGTDADRTQPEEERSTVRYDAAPTVVVSLPPARAAEPSEQYGPSVKSAGGPPAAKASRPIVAPVVEGPLYEAGGTKAIGPDTAFDDGPQEVGRRERNPVTRRLLILLAGVAVALLGVLTALVLSRQTESVWKPVPVRIDAESPAGAADAGAADARATSEAARPEVGVRLHPPEPSSHRRRADAAKPAEPEEGKSLAPILP
jgi:serine/threonine protein kinase